MQEIIVSTALSAILTGGVTWFFTIKFTRKQAEADAMLSVQNVYQELIQDLKDERTENRKEISAFKKTISDLNKRVQKTEEELKKVTPFVCWDKMCKLRKITM